MERMSRFSCYAYSFLTALGVSSYLALFAQPGVAQTFGFENMFGDFDTAGITSIEDASFGSGPTEGTSQALLSTGGSPADVFFPIAPPLGLEGNGAVSGFLFLDDQITNFGSSLSPTVSYNEGSAIRTSATISVNAGDILSFDYNFLTDENSALPIGGNDLAFFSIDNVLTQIVLFNDVESSLVASATSFSRETGFQTLTSAPFSSAGNITLGFGVVDGGDFAGDSGLLVDNIQVLPAAVPEPSTIIGTLFALGIGAILERKRRLRNRGTVA